MENILEGKRVLVVEDNEWSRDIVYEVLLDAGLTVDLAVDGIDAVEKVREAEPGFYDVILMDIQMPRMDGYHATEEIRKIEQETAIRTPIIAMTANAFDEDKRKAFESGMDEHIAKPIDFDFLLDTMADIIEKKR